MRPFWHPLSALYLSEPRAYASDALLRMLIRSGEPVELLCGGDRMWPAAREPRRIRVEPCDAAGLHPGDAVVVAGPGRIPDLLRVVGVGTGGTIRLRGDADIGDCLEVPVTGVLGRVVTKRRRVGFLGRRRRRLAIDLREAVRAARFPQGDADPALSVLEKYDAQAPFYVEVGGPDLDESLTRRIVHCVEPSRRVLVVGSGVGRECFALARAGFEVRGVDFAPAMIEHARRGAAERGLAIDFVEADIRAHAEPAGGLGAVLFTYDVFSFLPLPEARLHLLCRMRDWLAADGVVFLSARLVRRSYERCILTLQWLRNAARPGVSWGDSHTRYLSPDGRLRRSYVHYFTPRRLRAEAARAGMWLDHWTRGHVELRHGESRSAPEEDPSSDAP